MWSNLARAEWEMQMRLRRARAEVEQARLAREARGSKVEPPWWRTLQASLGWLRRLASVGPAWLSGHAAAS
jgi:hypothetical protein